MDIKLTTADGWSNFAKKNKLTGNRQSDALQKALKRYEEVEEQEPDKPAEIFKRATELHTQAKNILVIVGQLRSDKAVTADKAVLKVVAEINAHWAATAHARGADKEKAAKGVDQANDQAKAYAITVDGKNYVIPEKEYPEFKKKVSEKIRVTALAAVRYRADTARVLWDNWAEAKKDHPAVDFAVSIFGPDLPEEKYIATAERAYKDLKSAVDAADLDKIVALLPTVEFTVNKAYEVMRHYDGEKGKWAGRWVKGLTFTRDAAFKIVKVIAKAELAAHPKAAAASDKAVDLVEYLSTKLGEYIAEK